MPLMVLTGASGAGKTTIASAIEHAHGERVDVFYMDRIGVPSAEDMVANFGSGEEWQRAATRAWMERLAPLLADGRTILFEGQTRFAFLKEAAENAGIANWHGVLVDCDDPTRGIRLASHRGQAELANSHMMNWAAFLRREAIAGGYEILDTTDLSLADEVEWVLRRLGS